MATSGTGENHQRATPASGFSLIIRHSFMATARICDISDQSRSTEPADTFLNRLSRQSEKCTADNCRRGTAARASRKKKSIRLTSRAPVLFLGLTCCLYRSSTTENGTSGTIPDNLFSTSSANCAAHWIASRFVGLVADPRTPLTQACTRQTLPSCLYVAIFRNRFR